MNFDGTTAALGTLHGKEQLIAPALAGLGLHIVVEPIDTNRFGTFVGDVARPGPPDEVVVSKARSAAAAADVELGLASEGSFFAHPDNPFVTLQRELVALVDRRTGLVVIGRSQQFAPWARSMDVGRPELDLVRRSFDLPRQAVVVRRASEVGPAPDGSRAVTDVRTPEQLLAAFDEVATAAGGVVRVEPDLRADRCPLRHAGIVLAAEDLASRLARSCDDCGSRGVGLERVEPGRPCAWCGGPTLEVLRRVHVCPGCNGESFDEALGTADPGSCPVCNP